MNQEEDLRDPLNLCGGQQMTQSVSESSLTILMGSICTPDRNASRRVPRSGFAFTRYLNPRVRWC